MAETTQFKNITKPFLYPKNPNKLYTKEEFELLDSIYSDCSDETEKSNTEEPAQKETEFQRDSFWIRNRQELLALQNNKHSTLNNIAWFFAGMIMTSVAFLIYSQMTGSDIRPKQDIQIVFQKKANVMTEEAVNPDSNTRLDSNEFAKNQVSTAKKLELPKINFNFPKPVEIKKVETTQAKTLNNEPIKNTSDIQYHTIRSGDSLWIIANKYYSNPSQENINKIMKANNIRSVYSTLQLGQKLTIPQ